MNYLDVLPRELLSYLIPNDYVYTTLQIFDESDRYQIFVDYINWQYPEYYKILKLNSNLSFRAEARPNTEDPQMRIRSVK
jgi:hypothetical protein